MTRSSTKPRARALARVAAPAMYEVAVHEAGHIVTALAWVGDVHEAMIVREPRQGEPLGGVRTRRTFREADPAFIRALASTRSASVRRYARALARACARYSLGGWAAECLQRQIGVDLLHSVGDADVDQAFAALRAGDGLDATRDERGLHATIARAEFRRARELLGAHWALVERLAAALVDRGTLDENAIVELVDVHGETCARGECFCLMRGEESYPREEWNARTLSMRTRDLIARVQREVALAGGYADVA